MSLATLELIGKGLDWVPLQGQVVGKTTQMVFKEN